MSPGWTDGRLIVRGHRAAKFIGQRSSFALLQEALLGKGLARTRFEISLQAASRRSSATATYERRTAGKYLLVETTWPC